MAQFKYFDKTDILKSEKLKTYGAWSDSPLDANNIGESALTVFYTSSAEVSGWDGNYFWNIFQSDVNTVDLNAPVQLSIAFATSGAITLNNSDQQLQYTFPSNAVYKQFVNFVTSQNSDGKLQFTSGSVTYNIANAFVISVARDRFRDGLEPTTWQLNLAGGSAVTRSFVAAAGDGSTNQAYYEIVSGSVSITPGSTPTYYDSNISYGRMYPDKGIFVLDANKISGSFGLIYGVYDSTTSPYDPYKGLTSIWKALSTAAYFQLRSTEKEQSSFYFVRAKNFEFNATENPTWTSGSNNDVRADFTTEPRTYITSIGLYDDQTIDPLAVAKISSPLLKTQETECLVRVKLNW